MGTKKRILIFNVNWLGDVLFSTAVIRNIRYSYPDSFIACVIPPRCYPILEGNTYLNEIIVFDEKTSHKSILAKLNFIRQLKKEHFDMVFLLHRSKTRALLCWLAGIPERIGYLNKNKGLLLTKKIVPVDQNSVHRMDYYLNLIKGVGLEVKDKFTDFFTSEQDLRSTDDFLKVNSVKKEDFLVGMHPGGNWGLKRWKKENFAELANLLIKEFNVKIILTGSEKDIELGEEIKKLSKGDLIIAAGKLTLKQFGALCKRLDLFISADSGPMHIANAAGAKRIIALFGPTDISITGPRPADKVAVLQKNVGCKIPCYEVECSDNRCMQAINARDVIAKAKEMGIVIPKS